MKPVAIACVLIVGLWLILVGAAYPAEVSVHHDLSIVLLPEAAQLTGRDRLQFIAPPGGSVNLRLAPHAWIREIRINGSRRPFTFESGRLTVNLDATTSATTVHLEVDYSCRFDDPAPIRPLNTDNPGFGVSGTISPQGSFLLAGAGWYPRVVDARESVELLVEGPGDYVAVTTGRRLGVTHEGQRSFSRWRIDPAPEGLSLSAGPYRMADKSENGYTAATFLFAPNQALSATYLEATLHYLKYFSDRFGAFPYAAFSVVENFFPTGYGFPAYTLIGGRVLRLPFIPHTSLPHEIVHNWWGNGVHVDFASGNWCEGLATYTADYLIREDKSPASALDYRRQALRNYASLVSAETDFPLRRFQSRTDPATKAVGYDKSAMVFHMLRQEMGDAAFWDALRNLYRQFRFKRASWNDLREIFEEHAGRTLKTFFEQWIDRPGAPQLRLENVRQVRTADGGYRTTGRLVQEAPFFDLSLKLVLETAGDAVEHPLRSKGRETAFAIGSPAKPLRLAADPGHHLFRRLAGGELPATINNLRGASAPVTLVIADRLGSMGPPLAKRFATAMGIEPARTVVEANLATTDTAKAHVVFIGLPERDPPIDGSGGQLALGSTFFSLDGQRFDRATDTLFSVIHRPGDSGTVIALLHPLSPTAADDVIYKIPHYGRYSYLAFRDGQNRAKGTWTVKQSPMRVAVEPETSR